MFFVEFQRKPFDLKGLSVSKEGQIEKELVGAMGFEPMTPASRTLCADQTAPRPVCEAPIINATERSVK